MHWARRGRILAAALVAVAVLVPVGRSGASCVGPGLTLQQGSATAVPTPDRAADEVAYPVRLDQAARVQVIRVGLTCNDTPSTGCGGPDPRPSPAAPLTDVDLVLLQSGQRYVLGRADTTGDDHAVSYDVRWPAAARPGPGTLQLETAGGVQSHWLLQLS